MKKWKISIVVAALSVSALAGCPPEVSGPVATTGAASEPSALGKMVPGSDATTTDSAGYGWYIIRDPAHGVTCYAHNGSGLACVHHGAEKP